jgi:hypothetical protein
VKFFNDTEKWAGWNATPEHTDILKTYDCSTPIKQKSREVGNYEYYEHQRAKDYLKLQHRNSNNSPITPKLIASEHSCKVLHQQNPLTIPCGRRPRE